MSKRKESSGYEDTTEYAIKDVVSQWRWAMRLRQARKIYSEDPASILIEVEQTPDGPLHTMRWVGGEIAMITMKPGHTPIQFRRFLTMLEDALQSLLIVVASDSNCIFMRRVTPYDLIGRCIYGYDRTPFPERPDPHLVMEIESYEE